jgi:DNA polymerase V
VKDDIDLNTHLIKNIPSTFLIRVQGKSMNSVGIHNNDLLIVDRSLNPKNFSTVIANVNEELVVKTFIKEKDKSFLTSGSKRLKDKINLTENPEIFIWGVVTYVIHALQ